MAAKQIVEEALANNKVVIFSKSWCPFCTKAKGVFASDFPHLKDQIYVKELDLSDDGPQIQDYLRELTGQGTVPNIFINKQHIGGCDKVVNLRSSDKLAGLVEESA